MKNVQILVFGIISLLLIISCQKEQITKVEDTKTEIDQKVEDNNGLVYIYKGEIIDRSDIDWESESLNIVHGFIKENEVLLFDNDDALIAWAQTVEGGEIFINTLNNVAEALEMAEQMGEFERLELTGDVSEEYKMYLTKFVQSANRGLTKLFEHTFYLGSTKDIWIPTPSVGSSFNNEASSIQYATIGGFLANYRWWGGSKYFYATPAYGQDPTLGDFNDKTTSVWIN